MAISLSDVEYVAKLARLDITEEQKEDYAQKLNDILDYMEQLNELDTTGVEPTTHVLPLVNVMREDVVKPSLDRDKALANAPRAEGGYFRVPRIM